MDNIKILSRNEVLSQIGLDYISDHFVLFQKYRSNIQSFVCFCYFRDNLLIGLTELEFEHSYLFLNSICVDILYRNQKVASKLLQEIIKYCKHNKLVLKIRHYTPFGQLYVKPVYERLIGE